MTEKEWKALRDRFWNSTTTSANGCRIWQMNISNGHARFSLRKVEQAESFKKREVSAHLVAWWLTNKTIETFVDRTCNNTLCVEPTHLEARTKTSRFWQKVDKSSVDSCWPWKAGKHTFGYGVTGEGTAHRIAYELSKGKIPDGMIVRHTCHNPTCCRPDHLIVGTQKDNIQDMIDAGRAGWVSGEKAGLSKFTNEQAQAVRTVFEALSKVGFNLIDSITLISKLTEVTNATIWRIIKNRSY
jgi:hypothetical protein